MWTNQESNRGGKSIASTALILLVSGSFVMAEDTPQPVFDFTGADAAKEWQTVNDGVMGGVSGEKFKITDKKTLEFFGTLSLENNGGFASVRTKAKWLGLEKRDTPVAKSVATVGIFAEPLPRQAAGGLLVPSDGSNQEG